MSLKLTDLLEGWYDPPEYDEPTGDSFVDSDYNDVNITFDFIGRDKQTGLFVTKHKETGKMYVSHTDNIDFDMYTADTYSVEDHDEDGRYSYEEIDKDNAELTVDSMVLYCSVAYEEDDMGKDFDEWESGIAIIEVGNIILRGFYLHDQPIYKSLIKIIEDYSRKERKLKDGK
jgi:hypothetical protein